MKKLYTAFLLIALLGFSKTNFAQSTVTCDSIIQTSTCAGGNVIIPFTTSGNFNFGNVFTAEMSDMWGSFANPVVIGSIPWFTSGLIFATIPANANFGFLYRVRIIASNPVDTSNTSPNTIIITQVAQLNQIVPNPGDSACPGDTITLTAINIANSYAWSTGDTTQSIQVTQAGTYSVTTTDFLFCQSSTSDTVYFDPSFCTGIAETDFSSQVDVFPNPAEDYIHIRLNEGNAQLTSVSLYNAQGALIRTEALVLSGNQPQTLSTSGLAAGLYQLILESDGNRATKRVVVR